MTERLRSPVYDQSGYETIIVTPISPCVGAEIGGIDATKPLSNKQVEELHRAFVVHQVLFFRDQKIGQDDQMRLAGYFGRLEEATAGENSPSKKTGNRYVRKFHYDETSPRVAGENWHADQTCLPVPPLGSMLYNHTVPPYQGGGTMFASMYAAYDALSSRMKTYLDGLTATHDGTRVFGPGAPVSVHPVVVRHPESGRELIYVNRAFTSKINELPRREGIRLLELLFEHVSHPEWTCRFQWTPHSIAFWDNRCTQHYAISDYWPNVRSGFRVQLEGETAPAAG